MIGNTHYQTRSVAEDKNIEIAQSKRSKQINQWHIPQAEKLSKADLHIHSTYSDGIPTIEQILHHTERQTSLRESSIHDLACFICVCNSCKPASSFVPGIINAQDYIRPECTVHSLLNVPY